MDKSNPDDVLANHRKMAEKKLCEDVPGIADWICGCSGQAEFSEYWGRISSQELVQLCFGGELNEEQCKSALDELRSRYIADYAEQLDDEAGRI